MLNRLLPLLALLVLAAPLRTADNWSTVDSAAGLPSDEIQVLRETPDGSLWIGTTKGLAVHRGGKVEVVIPKGQIWEVATAKTDMPGEVWVGTGNGIVKVLDGKATPVYQGGIVGTIMPGGNAPTYAIALSKGTEQKTLITNATGTWQPVDHFKDENVLDVLRTDDGKLWVAIEGKGLVHFDPTGDADPAIHLEGAAVTTMHFDRGGQLWVGTWGGGLHVLRDGKWSRHLTKEKAQLWAIREDSKGNIWVSTDQNGLWRHDGNTWSHDLAKEGGVNLLETTSDGRVWISTSAQGGLRYWDGKQWATSLDSPFPIARLIETKSSLVAGGVLDGVHILKKK